MRLPLQQTGSPSPAAHNTQSYDWKTFLANYHLSPARAHDIGWINALEHRVYRHPWRRVLIAHEILFNPRARVIVLKLAAHDVAAGAGYLFYRVGEGEVHLTNIAIDPRWQGRRLGYHFLAEVMGHLARAGYAIMWLEVRVGNERAKKLYHRLGFRVLGVEPAYYPDGEDAELMAVELAGYKTTPGGVRGVSQW